MKHNAESNFLPMNLEPRLRMAQVLPFQRPVMNLDINDAIKHDLHANHDNFERLNSCISCDNYLSGVKNCDHKLLST